MTELTVIQNERKTHSDPIVITRLEEALEMAKQGSIMNCALVLVATDGQVLDCWASGDRSFEMVGALESLKLDFMLSNMEMRSDT